MTLYLQVKQRDIDRMEIWHIRGAWCNKKQLKKQRRGCGSKSYQLSISLDYKKLPKERLGPTGFVQRKSRLLTMVKDENRRIRTLSWIFGSFQVWRRVNGL